MENKIEEISNEVFENIREEPDTILKESENVEVVKVVHKENEKNN